MGHDGATHFHMVGNLNYSIQLFGDSSRSTPRLPGKSDQIILSGLTILISLNFDSRACFSFHLKKIFVSGFLL